MPVTFWEVEYQCGNNCKMMIAEGHEYHVEEDGRLVFITQDEEAFISYQFAAGQWVSVKRLDPAPPEEE